MVKESNKQLIRSSILNAKNTSRQSVTIDFFGNAVEIRQPTIGQLAKLTDTADGTPSMVSLLLEYCYVPGTSEKVFEEADRSELNQLPTGRWLKEFNKAIEDLIGLSVEEAEKN